MPAACPITTLVPVRRMPSDRSEMTTQVIFGQRLEILEDLNAWTRIRIADDGYEGWVDSKMISIAPEGAEEASDQDPYLLPWFLSVTPEGSNHEIILPPGSVLRDLNRKERSFTMGGKLYSWKDMLPVISGTDTASRILTAGKFMGSPYLWGGKSPFGIDCSGLVQLVCAIHGIRLPRDAHRQAETGRGIAFVQEARAGDLVFFGREENAITHVGMVTGKGTVIHASGMVREDLLDQEGIYNNEKKVYSHRLRLIRRPTN